MVDLGERFWSKVDRGEPDECWKWQAGKHQFDYGSFSVDGDTRLAHQLVFESEKGRRKNNVLHTCGNPSCVNPSHLYAGDQSDNNRDAVEHGSRGYSGEDNPHSKFTRKEVEEMREEYDETDVTYEDLAEKHDSNKSTIGNIVREDTWQTAQK